MLNLVKVKDIAYQDIELLLQALKIDYEVFGDNIYSNCPIHAGSNNKRGFNISTSRKQWKCWTHGCDQEYKDVIGLAQGAMSKRTGKQISFAEALKFVCHTYGIDSDNVECSTPQEIVEDELSKIGRIFKKTYNFKTIECKTVAVGDISQYFIDEQHFKKETLEHFDVRDCVDDDSEFKNRAVIPIHSDNGKLVGYTARATNDYILPKYLISPNFDKSNYLYNYNRAKEAADQLSSLFITEGQGDVWRLYEAGVINAVGLFGSVLLDGQLDILLKSSITNLVILTDNDQPGRESKIKLQRQLSRLFKLHFPDMGSKYKDIGAMPPHIIQEFILKHLKGLY